MIVVTRELTPQAATSALIKGGWVGEITGEMVRNTINMSRIKTAYSGAEIDFPNEEHAMGYRISRVEVREQ